MDTEYSRGLTQTLQNDKVEPVCFEIHVVKVWFESTILILKTEASGNLVVVPLIKDDVEA